MALASMKIPLTALLHTRKFTVAKFNKRLLSNLTTQFHDLAGLEKLNYADFVEKLRTDHATCDHFWHILGEQKLKWHEPFHTVSDCDLHVGRIRWYLGGELNASVNCIDRHLATKADKPALIYEQDEPGKQMFITYAELHRNVCRMANLLRDSGMKSGDTAIIYMPTSPAVVYAMLACARIGVAHSVVFAGFSSEALAARIQDVGAKVVITSDQAVRGGKIVELKRTVDAAVKLCDSQVERVFVSRRTGGDVPMGPKDVPLEKNADACSTDCKPEIVDSEHPLFVLYTSGSTGKPKGLVHTTGGYLVYAGVTHEHVFDYREGDLFGCVADVGWITGHSYVVYGPLVNGGTTLLFESTPTYPNVERYWETVERLGLTHLYLSPTALRLLLRYGEDHVNKYNLDCLRVLGCVGEPLNHEAWEWYHRVVGKGRCDIIDTWWQTETGGVCIAPRPSAVGDPVLPAMPMRPFYGLDTVLVDSDGDEVKGHATGNLCMRQAWPGMARTIWGDHKRFLDTYYTTYPGLYFTGDGAMRDEQGHYHITGRVDDVINISGHRLGTAEIEDVIDDHPLVSESAVIGYPHPIKGEAVYAYVVLMEDADMDRLGQLRRDLKQRVRESIAGYAVPEKLLFTEGLPKTRSGKIMRRVLKQIAAEKYDDIGDVTTLFDPSVVTAIVENHKKYQS